MTPHLPGIFGALAPLLDRYGYLAVAAFVFLEDFGVPLPGETILIAAAVYAGTGHLNVVTLGVVAVAAAVLGDNVGFGIGHFGGRQLVLRWGRYVFLNRRRLDAAERFFHTHGGKVVTVARFIEGLRQANGIIAGIAKMPWLQFVIFNLVGAILWVGLWVSVGYVAGTHIGPLYHQFQQYEIYVIVGIVVVIAALVARHVIKRRRE